METFSTSNAPNTQPPTSICDNPSLASETNLNPYLKIPETESHTEPKHIDEIDHFEGITKRWEVRHQRPNNIRGESCKIVSYGKTAFAINSKTKMTKYFGKYYKTIHRALVLKNLYISAKSDGKYQMRYTKKFDYRQSIKQTKAFRCK